VSLLHLSTLNPQPFAATIRADAAWRQVHATKPKHFDDRPRRNKALFKKLDRKSSPIPAIVAKAVKAMSKLNQ